MFTKNKILAGFLLLNLLGLWGLFAFVFFDKAAPITQQLGDEINVLLGAATLVLTVVTVLLPVVSILGWLDIRSHLDRLVDKKVQETTPALIQQELKRVEEGIHKAHEARFSAVAGSIYTQLYPILMKEIDARELLDVAIVRNRLALETMPQDSERRADVINNLAYCYALRRDRGDGPEGLKLAEALEEINRGSKKDPAYTDTWARVLIEFHDLLSNQETRLKDVKATLEETIRDGTRQDREYAQKNLDRLRANVPGLFS